MNLIFKLLAILQMKFRHVSLVLSRVGHGVSVITHPLVHVCPLTTLGDPHLREDPSKLSPRIRLGAPEFDLYVIIVGGDRLEAPLLELLLGQQSVLFLIWIRGS